MLFSQNKQWCLLLSRLSSSCAAECPETITVNKVVANSKLLSCVLLSASHTDHLHWYKWKKDCCRLFNDENNHSSLLQKVNYIILLLYGVYYEEKCFLYHNLTFMSLVSGPRWHVMLTLIILCIVKVKFKVNFVTLERPFLKKCYWSLEITVSRI